MSTFKVTTKLTKDSPAQGTTLTVDWTGITDEQLKAGYLSFLVVKVQSKWRRDEVVPPKATVLATEYAPGVRVAGVSPAEAEARLIRIMRGLAPNQLKAYMSGMSIADAQALEPEQEGEIS